MVEADSALFQWCVSARSTLDQQGCYPGDGLTKDHHDWEQGVSEAIYVIENLSYENDWVVDPFVGSSTTGIAAKRLNSRFVGCDEDEDTINTTLARLAQESVSER